MIQVDNFFKLNLNYPCNLITNFVFVLQDLNPLTSTKIRTCAKSRPEQHGIEFEDKTLEILLLKPGTRTAMYSITETVSWQPQVGPYKNPQNMFYSSKS